MIYELVCSKLLCSNNNNNKVLYEICLNKHKTENTVFINI